ncbi:putative endosome-associated ubiquitin isopeptidase [Mollisia scopiformis]|uniref:Putative endosome-associated ubiquitin isopeptidase n=1 Tax=Mollisia scopiformis TaxID=149040 RepID=A0A194XN21_MOLSC|nr:putative endosome-associated ubiquitin isopeptidase [Mollisia scopiformis]KUJ21484.1 putative endosome-associated ubiquitin isopeptidase [Mollisia scopiformis]
MAGQIARPMNIKEIAAKAQDFEFNQFIAMKYWLRTADTLLREAHIYEQEENDQQAYLLLMRYAALVAEKLPLHPSAKDPEYRKGIKDLNKTLPGVLDALTALKPRITARYDAWERALERRRDASMALSYERSRAESQTEFPAASDPAVAGNTTTLAAAENSELAVKLAHKEIRRRDAARRGPRQVGVSEEEEHERRTAGIWDDWEAALSKDSSTQDEDEVRRNMEASRRRMDGAHDIVPDGVRSRNTRPRPLPIVPRSGTQYRYPSINRSQPYSYGETPESRNISQVPEYTPPTPPPKERFQDQMGDVPPPRPEKAVPALPPAEAASPKAPPTFTFRPSAYLENGEPLRTVFLPQGIRQEFLKYAEPNTRRNLETCGMLCGTLISNALFISQVVIPDQKSTSDTCETTDDAAFFGYCEKEDLLQLGWIHTHPTQSCFMSSVDLHTHCAYQMMMKESIAIVCAPSKNPSWGVFRLTDPPGKQAVAKCRNTGLFHPHSEDNIYTDALKPGHVFEADGMEFSVVDLRT